MDDSTQDRAAKAKRRLVWPDPQRRSSLVEIRMGPKMCIRFVACADGEWFIECRHEIDVTLTKEIKIANGFVPFGIDRSFRDTLDLAILAAEDAFFGPLDAALAKDTEGEMPEGRMADSHADLLAALEETLSIARVKWGNLDPDANIVMDRAHAALAKARGATP